MATPPPAANGTTPQAPIPNIPGKYPLKAIKKPHAHDVLCGRGGGTNNHIGNNQWRTLVNANKRLYISLPKRQKMLVAQSIVEAVRSQDPPGRFLQKDASSNTWCDIGDQKAQFKTSQALREGAPDLRISMKEEVKLDETQGCKAVHRAPGMPPSMAPMTASPVMGGSPMMYSPQQHQMHFEDAVMYNHAAMQAAMMYQQGFYLMFQPPPQPHGGQNAFYPNGAPPFPPQIPTARSPSPATKSDSELTDAKDAQPAAASAAPAPSASDNSSEKEPLGQTETAAASGSDKPGTPAPQSAPPINEHSHNDKMTIPIQKEPLQHPDLKSTDDKLQEEEQHQQKQQSQSKDSPTPATSNGSSGSHIHFFDNQPKVDETSEFQRMMNHRPNVDNHVAPAPFPMHRPSNPCMTNESSLIYSDDEDDAPPPVNNNNSLKVMPEMHNQPPPDQANGPVVLPTSLHQNASATMSDNISMSDIISVDDISLQSMSISRNVSRTLAGMAHDAGGAYIDTNPTNFERAASLAFSEMSLSRGVSLSGPGDVGAIPNPYSGGGKVTFAPGVEGGEEGIFQQQQQQQQAKHEQLSLQHTMSLPTQPQGTTDSISQTSAGVDSNGLKTPSNASVSTIQRQNQQHQQQQQNQQGGENAAWTPNDREALEMMYLARGASLAFENFETIILSYM